MIPLPAMLCPNGCSTETRPLPSGYRFCDKCAKAFDRDELIQAAYDRGVASTQAEREHFEFACRGYHAALNSPQVIAVRPLISSEALAWLEAERVRLDKKP